MNTWFSLLVACFISIAPLGAQSGHLDRVFQLGTEELRYEKLTSTYSQTLLEATGNDITRAFESWLHMQQEMDAYALSIGYDLKGVKLWLQVFWAGDGKIDYIGYLLRPDSRLVDNAELRAFLAGFLARYTLPVTSSRPFNHYTGATFPTLSQRAGQ